MLIRLCLVVVGTMFILSGSAFAQPEDEGSAVPSTPWGHPDLQGVWDFRTATPLQRPASQADKAFLTEEEAAAFEAQGAARRARLLEPSEVRTEPLAAGGGGRSVGAYNDFWLDYGTNVIADRRTSLIVDPPDGRLPPLTPEGEDSRQIGSLWEDLPIVAPVRVRSAGTGSDHPEDRGLAERCLMGFNSGPPMMPSGYNNNMQLFQSADTVVIVNEMVHDARIIPLDAGRALSENIRQWMGSSHGYWDGDTLVVETSNFNSKRASFDPSAMTAIGTGETVQLTERFSRLDPATLLYEFTIDDPAAFTKPFTVAIPMRHSVEPMFEYACHEGNYGLVNILRGARVDELTSPSDQ
jgi:hypothetical protein